MNTRKIHYLYKKYLTQLYTLIHTSLYEYIYVQAFDEINIQTITSSRRMFFFIWNAMGLIKPLRISGCLS